AIGVDVRTGTGARRIAVGDDGATVSLDDEELAADAVVLATDPRAARGLAAAVEGDDLDGWRAAVAATVNAPPFTVVRLWLDAPVAVDRPAFLGTSGYGPLDNVSVLERFEGGARDWAAANGGSVVELHAYACDPAVASDDDAAAGAVAQREPELHQVYPETARAGVLVREVLVRDDCTLIGPERWEERPGVATPSPRLVLAGDWVRCNLPVALMERAATTGFLAANQLLQGWGVAGHDLWTVPMTGLLRRAARR